VKRLHAAVGVAVLLTAATAAFAATTPTAETRGAVPVGASGGPLAGVTADRTDLTEFSINQSAARISTSAGEVVIDGQNDAYARIDQFEGPYTNISDVNTNGGAIRVSPADKQLIEVAGGIEGVAWRPKSETALDDGQVDFTYNTSGGNGEVRRVSGLPTNTEVAAISDDTATPKIQDTATTDASGQADFDGLDGEHDIRLRETPETLFIRNESNPSELVDGNATDPVEVEIRFFLADDTDSPDQVVSRSTTDGTVNMTGLPKNESFVVVADAEGYESRRIFVRSLIQQETIYLLPTNQPSLTKQYQLTDFTGIYPQKDSVLQIQRALNGSWETVQGDFFGASGEFEAILREGERHRLVILNTQTGESRVLGRVTPLNPGAQEIEIQSRDDIELSRIGPLMTVEPSTRALPASDTDVTISVDALNTDLTSWNYSVELVEANGSTTTLATDSFGSEGSANPSFNLTNDESATLRVSVGWETADGRTLVDTTEFRIVPDYGGYSLLDGLFEFPTLFSSSGDGAAATTMIALFASVFGAGAVGRSLRPSTEGIGLVALGILAIFAIIGWIGYPVVFACAVVWTALVALRRGL